ncbi:MAG: low specificity L-threonine aldolase, partial [Bacteroidota bacterium]
DDHALVRRDHARARQLAETIEELPRLRLLRMPDTNIVMFDVDGETAVEAIEGLADDGVLMVPFGPQTLRATTHRDLSDEDIALAQSSLARRYAT